MTNKRTPLTMRDAISDGLETAPHLESNGEMTRDNIAEFIEPRVRDYLAQVFGAAMLKSSDEEALKLKKLFCRIVNE